MKIKKNMKIMNFLNKINEENNPLSRERNKTWRVKENQQKIFSKEYQQKYEDSLFSIERLYESNLPTSR